MKVRITHPIAAELEGTPAEIAALLHSLGGVQPVPQPTVPVYPYPWIVPSSPWIVEPWSPLITPWIVMPSTTSDTLKVDDVHPPTTAGTQPPTFTAPVDFDWSTLTTAVTGLTINNPMPNRNGDVFPEYTVLPQHTYEQHRDRPVCVPSVFGSAPTPGTIHTQWHMSAVPGSAITYSESPFPHTSVGPA